MVDLLSFGSSSDAMNDGEAVVVKMMMDMIEDYVSGQVYTFGKQWNKDTSSFMFTPADLLTNPPKVYTAARQVALEILKIGAFDGVQCGVSVRHTEPLHNIPKGRLVSWTRGHRDRYAIESVVPSSRHTFTARGSFVDKCVVLLYHLTTCTSRMTLAILQLTTFLI